MYTSADLNKEQQEVLFTNNSSLLVVAGAGTGKTRIIVEKIAHLIAGGVSGDHILALTFTNKAADEMKNRITKRVPQTPPQTSTFHAFCTKVLREHYKEANVSASFTIADSEFTRRILRRLLKAHGIRTTTPRTLQEAISQIKTTGVVRMTPSVVTIAEELYPEYELELAANKALDFDDLLVRCVALLKNNPSVHKQLSTHFTHIFVDEFQDIDALQGTLLRQLHTKNNVVIAVGDTDQTIYSWRGASIDNMLSFTEQHKPAKTILLTKNYRSTQSILSAANAVIEKNTMRQEKELIGTQEGGKSPILIRAHDEEEEAGKIANHIQTLVNTEGFSYNDFAILFRANFQARALESRMLAEKMPYRVTGVRFFQRAEVSGLLAYLTLARNRNARDAFIRAVGIPSRGIGAKTIEKLFSGQRNAITPRIQKKVQRFEEVVDDVRKSLETQTVAHTLQKLIKTIDYDTYLNETFGNPEERKQEVYELIAFAEKFSHLQGTKGVDAILTEAALSSDQDTLRHHRDGVRLMTVHAAKGLEFPVVFLSGLEEGLFPFLTTDDRGDAEEERRLCYVAITRAQKLLYCSYARRRSFLGKYRTVQASSFLYDIFDDQALLALYDDFQDRNETTPGVIIKW